MGRPEWDERQARNDKSRNHAKHYAEPWLDDEVELLLQWDGTEEELALTAEVLGRTIEACRQMFYVTRRLASRRETSRRRIAYVRQRAQESSPTATGEQAGGNSSHPIPRTVSRAAWSAEDLADYPEEWYQ